MSVPARTDSNQKEGPPSPRASDTTTGQRERGSRPLTRLLHPLDLDTRVREDRHQLVCRSDVETLFDLVMLQRWIGRAYQQPIRSGSEPLEIGVKPDPKRCLAVIGVYVEQRQHAGNERGQGWVGMGT